MLRFNAVGAQPKPFIILQDLQKLPDEFKELTGSVAFASSVSGWMTKNLFFCWCITFAHFISYYRLSLDIPLQNQPVILTVDESSITNIN